MDDAGRARSIARIRKLLAIANDGKEDAETAAEMAAKLMLKHQIESVEELDDSVSDPVTDNSDLYIELAGSPRFPWWKWELSWKVASNGACKPYKLARIKGDHTKGSGISFIGRRSDAQLCCYLFLYLMRELERLHKDRLPVFGSRRIQYIPGGSPLAVDLAYQRRWSRDFYTGAISALEARMVKARDDVMSESWSDDSGREVEVSTTALARIDLLGRRVDETARAMGLLYESAPSRTISTQEGWAHGIRAGNEVDLSVDHRALTEGLARLPPQGKR